MCRSGTLSSSSHCYWDKLGHFLDGVLESGLPEWWLATSPSPLRSIERTSPSCASPLVPTSPCPLATSPSCTIQVHSNVTLAARRRHPHGLSGPQFSKWEGKVLKSGRWPGLPWAPGSSPCSCAAHNRAEHDCKGPFAGAGPNHPAAVPPSPLRPFWPALASRWPRGPSKAARVEGLVGRAHGRMIGPVTSASLTKRRHGGHRARHGRR